jgi:aminoglycoside phosphotransferase
MGYKGIVGVGLHTIIEQLAKAKKIQLGTYIGSFLKNFHSQQLEGIPIFTVASEIALLQEKYQLSRPIIASSVPASDVIKLDTYIKSTLSQELHFLGSKTVLSHGDLGLWNMLYTNDGNLGFIDFEDIGYYDESKDFTGLTDPLMLNSALRAYGSDSPELRQKIIARSKITTINDVSFFKDKDNAKALKFTIDKIMQFIA